MRWKVHWDRNKDKIREFESFGFRSLAAAPYCKELKPFEDDLLKMIGELETRPFNNPLQTRLKNDLAMLRRTPDSVVVSSDKTNNFYLMNVEEYQENLRQEIRRNYKKVGREVVDSIDEEAASFATKRKLDNRIEGIALKPSFLTIKDHKEDFPQRVSYRTINPTKPNLGVISKTILQRINLKILEATKVNLWRSTKDVIDWFKELENKDSMTFFKFDIESFFPSISKELLHRTLDFVQTQDYLSEEEIELIFHCRKNVLVGPKGEIWLKAQD